MYSYNDCREASRREAMAAARMMQPQPQAVAATMTPRQYFIASLFSLLNLIISPLSLIILSLITIAFSLVLILLGL